MNIGLRWLLVVFAFAKADTLQAQTGLGETITDMVFILDRYIEPATQASVLQTSAGWYNDARALDVFQVRVSANVSGLFFPKNKQTVIVNDSDFLNLDIRDASTAAIPTALGDNRRVFFDFVINGEQYEFQAIGGLETGAFAFPYVQGTMGLWKETDVTLRYGPTIKIEKSSYALYGIGVKHNISQYLFKDKRSVELAVIANYSLVDFNVFFNRLELAAANGNAPIAVLDGYLTDFHAINLGAVASKQHGNWVYSGGLNYNVSWLDYSLIGRDDSFLRLFNESLGVLSEKTGTFKIDAGATYKFPHIDVYTQLSTDFSFVNMNIGTAYTFD